MRREIKKLFGDRVALQLVEEEYEGMLVPAPSPNKMHVLSKVIAIGDKCKELVVGDIVLWQNNGLIERNCRYVMDGKPVFVLLRGDMIARLTNRLVKLGNFQILGEWCLVRKIVEQPSSLIVLPDSAQESNPEMVLRFILEQKGNECDVDVAVGDELIVDRTRSNPLRIHREDFYYVHKNCVLGVIAPKG
jgi:co-chaperonin GroES (HSP10)